MLKGTMGGGLAKIGFITKQIAKRPFMKRRRVHRDMWQIPTAWDDGVGAPRGGTRAA